MFHLTRKTDYGLILILELMRRGLQGKVKPMSLRQIAKQYCISFFFLQKIAKELREKRCIQATRGKDGGYTLSKEIEKMSLHELFSILEGSVSIISCFNSASPLSGFETKCDMPAHKGLALLNRELQKTLKNIRLTDFFSEIKTQNDAVPVTNPLQATNPYVPTRHPKSPRKN